MRAATAGNVDAQHMLGVCYANGAGVVRDLTAARTWLARAAAAGSADSPAALARLDAHEAAR